MHKITNCVTTLKATRQQLPAAKNNIKLPSCNLTSRSSAGAAHQPIEVSDSNRPPVAGIGHAPVVLLQRTGIDSRQDVSAGSGRTDLPFPCPYWDEIRERLDLHLLRLEIYKFP
jgi:hypothetical protein